MTIEIEFNSIIVSQEELQEHLPNLISAVSYYFPKQKPTRRKRRKKKVSVLIDDIIDSIEEK